MKAIVTGACGSLGTYLVRMLAAAQVNVTGFDNMTKTGTRRNRDILTTLPGVSVLYGNCLEISDYGPADIIFHLAGDCSAERSLTAPVNSFRANALMTCVVLEAARKRGTPVIYTSSVRAHPNTAGQRTIYGLGKWVGDLLCTEYARTFGIPTISNRFGAIYGVHQHGTDQSGWLSWFVRSTVCQMRLELQGGGEQRRDCLHNRDASRLLLHEADYLIGTGDCSGPVYDVGGGETNFVSLLDVLSYLRDHHGYSLDHVVPGPRRQADADGRFATNELVFEEFGWGPVTTVWDGIDELVGAAEEEKRGREIVARVTSPPV